MHIIPRHQTNPYEQMQVTIPMRQEYYSPSRKQNVLLVPMLGGSVLELPLHHGEVVRSRLKPILTRYIMIQNIHHQIKFLAQAAQSVSTSTYQKMYLFMLQEHFVNLISIIREVSSGIISLVTAIGI